MNEFRDWDDLRFFLAVARLGSLSAAARSLKVDPATVSRRVERLEKATAIRCFERRADGYRLTDTGRKLLLHAERVEEDLLGLSRALDAEDKVVSGLVAVTASEVTTLSFLIPALPGLRERYPGIRLDLVSTNRVLSLARREADIALRMVRPEEGDLLARKVATMRYGLYASQEYLARAGTPSALADLRRHALVDWFEHYPRVGTVAWFRTVVAESQAAAVRVNGTQERVLAATSGLGVVCLPFILARNTGLRRVLPEVEAPPVELWMLAHPDSARIRRIRAVMDYIVEAAAAANGRFTAPA